ncbi:aryl-alcohol dehydrogenase-like predicted oxidoreductase [Rhodoligotrophos appendicifer]|uniref:aldo/keto reductase n=1 Tax=Rhodoligotrophos appendicifer TaxID=987056 RepID=UPI001185EC15|nr:aldo/keto reductase [Rhodoligotrophos appendicifer]
MQYVRLGKTNLQVSRLSLGTMSFGSPEWRSWTLDKESAREVVKVALEGGINLFDSCNFYSMGRSEEILGDLIGEMANRDDVIIATKAGYAMRPAPTARGFSRKHLFEQVDASLRRLKMDYIDLYQTHIWDSSTNLDEMIVAFDDLVRSGKVLYVGATDMPAWQFVKCVTMAEERKLASFVTMQNHYNLAWREDERDLIPFCAAQGIGLLPYSPHARGLFCGPARRDPASQTERYKTDDFAKAWFGRAADEALAGLVDDIAAEANMLPSQVALAWVLSKSAVHSPIIGATRPHHVRDALAALELRLSPEVIARLEAAYVLRPASAHA